MKKLAFLALVLFAVLPFASCGEDGEIDYTLSFVSFTISVPTGGTLDQTYGNSEDCYASISNNTLDLKASKEGNSFRLQIPLTGEAPYAGTYQNCTASVGIGGTVYSGTIPSVTLAPVPDTAGGFVTGTFADGSVAYSGVTRTLSNGIINLVLVK